MLWGVDADAAEHSCAAAVVADSVSASAAACFEAAAVAAYSVGAPAAGCLADEALGRALLVKSLSTEKNK